MHPLICRNAYVFGMLSLLSMHISEYHFSPNEVAVAFKMSFSLTRSSAAEGKRRIGMQFKLGFHHRSQSRST